jgi:hypothetical protein
VDSCLFHICLESEQRDISPFSGVEDVRTHGSSAGPILRRMCGLSGGATFVAMMQAADLRYRHDSSHFHRLDGSRLGRVLS